MVPLAAWSSCGWPTILAIASENELGWCDPLESPQDPTNNSPTPAQGAEPPQPSEVDVVHALVDVEQATQNTAPDPSPPGTTLPPPGPSRAFGIMLYLSVGFTLILLLAWTVQNGVRRIGSWAASSKSNWAGSGGQRSGAISSQQAEAENLLARLAAGDSKAANEILSESDNWIGRTRRTTKANQLVNTALNQHDLLLRGAALQATLALDGVSRDGDGLNHLERAVTDPNTRAWGLWMLGALGNRGVQQERIVEILKGYLDDSDAHTRSGAVYGLGTVATDETVHILLDRFRNNASLLVQE